MSASADSGRMGTELTRYDLVLLVIPVAFLFGLIAAGLLSVPTHVPLVGAAVVGALAVGDAMFRNPPIEN